MSGEHLWSDWMSPFIPKGAHDTHIETWDIYTDNAPIGPTDVRKRHGHTTTRKLRRVCKSCNERWMSRIDEEAKPYILPMMYGWNVYLSEMEQKKVVDWIILKWMVFENNRREDAAATLEQRQAFMLHKDIPIYTQIHLFRCGDKPWDWQLHRHSASFIASPPRAAIHPRTKNAQSFTFGVGELLIYVLQAFAADIKFSFERIAARQIWPPRDDHTIWPPAFRATRDEAELLAKNIEEFIREQFGRG